ncbi:serpin-ZX-like [Olea europaea var. sylvestris]|uniref:Serpin-ZX-like n=1 Tax=Olea europaea subsp. europaea TaxID=158383 RepID=A0A8S0VPC4_OLEEU|nr:serpin-ZX-like [Olea europaea var. sylvestris]CAA3033219.1 serpin-ZX-like [Olea europaea subsp. europaea]
MDIRESVGNHTYVSLLLAKHLFSNKSKDANIVFSPSSIHPVLGLITAGSKGPTLDQLLTFLKSKTTEEINSLSSQLVTLVFGDGGSLGGPRLSFVNGVWVDQSLSLKPAFKEIVSTAYKAAASHVDFQTKAVEVTKEVNLWAEKETSGLIKEILPSDSVDSSTRLIFANAVYFKGDWDQKFDASSTKDSDFFLLNGSSVQVPFMTSEERQYIRAFSSFKVLGLPYKQGEDKRKFSIYLFLPDAKDGLPALVEKIGSESGFLENHLPNRQVKVGAFSIPKFKISFGFEASEVLKGLGLVLPFSGDGLTEMVDSPTGQNLYVSSIFHKSFIEVNEEGTEAAAATAGVVMLCSFVIEDELDFVADHPFLFVVREDTTGVLLFIGQIDNPLLG